jgi:hypothetical protein
MRWAEAAMIFVHVLMRWVFHHLSRIPRSTRSWLISLCGIAALLAMLMLWASMVLGIYKLAIGIWSISILIIYILVWSSPDETI